MAYCVGQLKPPVELELYQHQTDKLADADMIKYLADMCLKRDEQTLMKKVKRTPGLFRMRASRLGAKEQVPLCLTSTMYRVKPWNQDPQAGTSKATLEVQEFPLENVLEPHRTYRHNLYVYPKCVDLRNTSARNIACKIEFMDTEAKFVKGQGAEDIGQRVISTRGVSVSPAKSVHSVVTYHSKNPDFYDEVKLFLPAELKENHHLLFTFYHIQCKDTSKSSSGKDDPPAVGYAWFPLVKQRRIQTGMQELDIAATLPANYLLLRNSSSRPLHASPVASKTKWMDGKFTVSINLDSTVLSDDQYVQGFMLEVQDYLNMAKPDVQGSGSDHAAKPFITDNSAALRNLRDPGVSVQAVVHFLPSLLNQLLDIITYHKASTAIPSNGVFTTVTEDMVRSKAGSKAAASFSLAKEAFTSLCHVVHLVSTAGKKAPGNRSQDLLIYVTHMYHIWGPTGKKESAPNFAGKLFEELVFWLKQSLSYNKSSTMESKRPEARHTFEVCIRYTWFFLELTLKSSAQYIQLVSKATAGKRIKPRCEQLPPAFMDQIHDVVLDLVCAMCCVRVVVCLDYFRVP